MIVFNQVTKEYKNHYLHTALDNVSFTIDDGEFVFIVGPSGSGKSTIIKLILREETPTSGEIVFNDIEITKMKAQGLPILRREIGVVFQDYKLLQNKNVFENVSFTLEVSGKSVEEVKKTTDYILELVGLEEKRYNFPGQLSGGEMQRVAIARALVNDPQVLIADEPTGNLDPENAWDVIQILNKVNNWGTSVIMATHDKEVVNAISKRVIELEKGKVIRDEGKGKYDEEKNEINEEETTLENDNENSSEEEIVQDDRQDNEESEGKKAKKKDKVSNQKR